ncbi:MAG: T9SS type A sorting domain-containing protein [Cyclobacteriaceae bacterium]
MIRVVCFLGFLLPLASQAQFTYFLDQSIPVQDLQGVNLAHPWTGGLNAAEFNTMDLNGDGADDLVLFDRMGGKVITFVSADNQYVPAPEFENLFPADVTNWLLLRDYNCDGRKDIFTGDALGIKVYKNTTPDGEYLQWEQHLFATGFPGPKSGVLLTQGSNNKVNLQLQPDDLPAIGDVDGDGDLDILNIRYAGHTVEFHQNLSVENNQPCDSLDFKRITSSWGDFRECQCGAFAFNGESCPPSSGGRTKHAGGKSLLALDMNGDQQQDLIFSEADCNQLFALPNAGTTFNPVINNFSPFPATNPVNFVLFPAAFYEDVDFDGKKDLIATPNIFTKEFLNTNLQQSTWFYKNTGSTSSPVFSFVERNFLQKQMIDVGDNAVPALTDVDGDGDFDLFISRNSSENFVSTVYLYENTGSPESPAFKLLTDDFIGFSTARFYNVKIQFADMNGDQTPDLVFTASSFDNTATSLYYLNNKSQSGLDFNGASLQMVDFGLTSRENVYITDVNEDGLPDILAGRSEGNLEYWKNSGIKGSPLFALEEENFLGFDGSALRQNLTCLVADLDGDGQKDLAVGDQTGRLGVISDFQNASANQSELEVDIVFNPALEIYSDKNLGGRIWPTAANLFNTNKPTVVVGNVLGGIHILKHDEGESLPEEPELNIYPNPVAKNEVLNVKADRHGILQVFSVLGQQLSTPVVVKANQVHLYTLPNLASGLYLLKFTANKKSSTQRLVIK